MGENSFLALLILFNVMFVLFIGGIFLFIREYRLKKSSHNKELKSIEIVHKKELLETQLEIQIQTMKHIGQEIHDNIGQKLTLSSIYLQQLDYENKVPEISKKLNSINNILNQSLNELRLLSKSLTDDSISNLSISDLLSNECQKIRDLRIYTITFNDDIDIKLDAYRIKSILVRITQEFLQNSIKHSDCKNISCYLSTSDKYVRLVLKDDGKGFDVNSTTTKGIGLKNMKKRTHMLDGNFSLKSNKEYGTELSIEIPIK